MFFIISNCDDPVKTKRFRSLVGWFFPFQVHHQLQRVEQLRDFLHLVKHHQRCRDAFQNLYGRALKTKPFVGIVERDAGKGKVKPFGSCISQSVVLPVWRAPVRATI
jgi:hypothetical protein